MVAAVTFVIVMGLAFNTLLAANAVRQAASARIDIYHNARVTLDIIARELRNASLRSTDVTFSDSEKTSGLLNNLSNGRGRFLINDWPPRKEAAMGLDTTDVRMYRGNGVDDDADGQTDEEAFDGLDNDNDSDERGTGPRDPKTGLTMADGLDNNGNGLVDEGIDEDVFYPRDMINFMTLSDLGTGSDLIEVGYAIDTRTGRDLLRRTAYLRPDLRIGTRSSGSDLDGLYPIALNYEIGVTSNQASQFIPAPNTEPQSAPLFAPWFDPVKTDFGKRATDTNLRFLPEEPPIQGEDVVQEVEIVSLNILGFDCKAYYHDWVIAEENASRTALANYRKTTVLADLPPRTADDLAKRYNPYSFPLRSWDSSVENFNLLPYELVTTPLAPVLPNGENDMAAVRGSDLNQEFPPTLQGEEAAKAKAAEKTDGLPRLVEITLFVQDQNRYRDDPIKISTRVFLPFVTGDE